MRRHAWLRLEFLKVLFVCSVGTDGRQHGQWRNCPQAGGEQMGLSARVWRGCVEWKSLSNWSDKGKRSRGGTQASGLGYLVDCLSLC